MRPHKFNIAIEEADAAELARVLAASLLRERRFVRLRCGSSGAMPEWLKDRRADGALSIGSLAAGDTDLSVNQARLLWDAGVVRLTGIDATFLSDKPGGNLPGASLTGDLEADVGGVAPHYRFDGKLNEVSYSGRRARLQVRL